MFGDKAEAKNDVQKRTVPDDIDDVLNSITS